MRKTVVFLHKEVYESMMNAKLKSFLFGLILTAAIFILTAPAQTAPASELTPDPVIDALIAQIGSDTVWRYAGNLSGEWPVSIGGADYIITSRNTYSGEPITKAVQWVSEHFSNAGLNVTPHTWSPDAPPNVLGQIDGQTDPNDIVIISAHLDNMPNGSTAPGADDNGSGVVAVLIAADLLSQYEWDCTLRFALWTGEEQGLLGSKAYAAAIPPADNIRGVLNLDMIAYNGSAPPEIDLHARSALPESLTMAQMLADVVAAYALPLETEILIDNWLGNYSDNKSFWDQNIPAILTIEDYDDFNPYYHTPNDQIEQIDLTFLTANVKAAVATFAHMSGCLTPGQAPLPVAPDVTAVQDGNAMQLSWSHHPANVRYAVHRSADPFFTPDEASLLAILEPPFEETIIYTDTDSGLGNPDVNHTYLVLAYNIEGAAAESNRVAEFDFVTGLTPLYTYTVLNEYPHDPQAYTQGLVMNTADSLFEGTGLYGQSSLRRVNLETGVVLQQHNLDGQYFGEGVTLFNDKIMQLTWNEHTGFVYDKSSFALLDQFAYPTQGWGLTHDGVHLIMSDGTSKLYFLDPITFEEVKQVSVHERGTPIINLNELEYVQGEIFANVWLTDRIARINPQTGQVVGWINLAGLLTPTEAQQAEVLNGIAYDAAADRLFVTGKYWPKLFEIELDPVYRTMTPAVFSPN